MLVALPFSLFRPARPQNQQLSSSPNSPRHGSEPADLPAPDNSRAAAPESTSVLPFLGDEARKRGYVLPLPFGVGVNYMDMRQNINVDSINFYRFIVR